MKVFLCFDFSKLPNCVATETALSLIDCCLQHQQQQRLPSDSILDLKNDGCDALCCHLFRLLHLDDRSFYWLQIEGEHSDKAAINLAAQL